MSLSDRSTHFKLSAWCHHISAGLYQTEYIIYVCMCVNVLYILIFYKTPPFDNYATQEYLEIVWGVKSIPFVYFVLRTEN
jgi:hypothetical protein